MGAPANNNVNAPTITEDSVDAIIAQEEDRQRNRLGWSVENDDKWTEGQLAKGAAVYALQVVGESYPWPWDTGEPHRSTNLHDLAKAAALIKAEMRRRIRAGEVV